MAKSKNNSSTNSRSKLVQSDSASSTALPKVSNLSGATKSLSLSAKPSGGSLSFGKPSSAGTTTSSSSSILTNLLKQTASGGIASALGGGLGGLLGLGSIISGFVSLFGGGKSALPALVQFQAPASQDVVSYVGSASRSSTPSSQDVASYVGSGSRSSASTSATNSSTTNVAAGQPSGAAYQYQSAQIAGAVKQALLNSSSLNDVIAEI